VIESGVVLASVFTLLLLIVALILLPLLLAAPPGHGPEGTQIEFEEDDGDMRGGLSEVDADDDG
jgi:hypothetical protein